MPEPNIDPEIWISAREGGRRLGMPHRAFMRVVEAAGIRRLEIPGRWTRYHAGDVETVRKTSVAGGPVRPRAETAAAR